MRQAPIVDGRKSEPQPSIIYDLEISKSYQETNDHSRQLFAKQELKATQRKCKVQSLTFWYCNEIHSKLGKN